MKNEQAAKRERIKWRLLETGAERGNAVDGKVRWLLFNEMGAPGLSAAIWDGDPSDKADCLPWTLSRWRWSCGFSKRAVRT